MPLPTFFPLPGLAGVRLVTPVGFFGVLGASFQPILIESSRKRSLADFSVIPSSLPTASNFGQGKDSGVSTADSQKRKESCQKEELTSMSGLLLVFRIKSAKKWVWASFKVVDSLVLAILMVSARRT